MILVKDYYAPEDFMIGRTVDILRCQLEFESKHDFKMFLLQRQKFFIYDMDDFTRQFYR